MSLVSKLISFLSRAVALVALLVLVVPLGWRLFSGDQFLTVTGVSMRPTYELGDILVVQGPSGHELSKEGQIVVASFGDPTDSDQYYVHRIWEVTDGGALLKGDNNTDPDPRPISADHVVGTPRLHLGGGAADLYRESQQLTGRLGLVGIVALFGIGIPAALRKLDAPDTTDENGGDPGTTGPSTDKEPDADAPLRRSSRDRTPSSRG